MASVKDAVGALRVLATRRLAIDFDRNEFAYERLPWKKAWNWFKGELSFVFRTARPWGLPTHLQVEPANDCNLRCPLCHIVTDGKPRGFLALADFRRLIDEVGDHLLFLHFWGWGEPFLNPHIYDMIRYAKDRGIRIVSSTNGHFFRKTEDIDRLIDSELDVLICALDGVNRETYEKYRHRGDFDRVIDGIRALLARRTERGATLPRINLRMLVTRDNEEQVPAMRDLAAELGVDIFSLKTLCGFDNESEWKDMVPRRPEYQRLRPDLGDLDERRNRCKKPWNHPTVYRDGTVVPCDYFTGTEFSLGNAFESGFRAVWFGEDWRRFRVRFRREDYASPRCGNCWLHYADVDRCVPQAFRQPNVAKA